MLLAARYVLPVSLPHIENGAVLVRDGEIVEIGDAAAMRVAHPSEEFRDFGQAALMPGFVDLHNHLEYAAMRGLVDDLPYARWKLQLKDYESRFGLEDWDDSALLGVMEAIRSGITTVADTTNTGASLRAVQQAGLRAFVYREVSTMDKSRIGDVMTRADEDLTEWGSSVDPNMVTRGISPHSAYSCHPELYRAVADYATEHDMPITTHLAGSREEWEFVKYGSSALGQEYRERWGDEIPWLPTGVSPVRYVLQWGLFDAPNVLAVHCTQVDDADLEILRSRDVAVAFCPRCNAKLGMGIAPVRKMLHSGMRVGIGTDSPAMTNNLDVFDEMRVGLLLQRAVDAHQQFHNARKFVKLATYDAARALRAEGRIGSLEPGKVADIIAVDLSRSHQLPTQYPYSALVHSANQDNVMMTMVAGRVLFENGEWMTLDIERIRARSEELRVQLTA
ncbi:MAG: amidohydrolase family protein [Coriobacteriia bacterium]